LGNSPTGQTDGQIFALDGSDDADSRKDVAFGICWYCSPFNGSNSPKPQFWGMNRHFQAKRVKFKLSYFLNYCVDCNLMLHSDKDHQVGLPFVGGLNVSQTNPRWRTATILKNCCNSTTDWRILTKFGTVMHLDPLDPSANKIWECWKSKTAAALTYWKSKIIIFPSRIDRFYDIWHTDATRLSRSHMPIKIVNLKKFKMVPAAIFKKNRKITIVVNIAFLCFFAVFDLSNFVSVHSWVNGSSSVLKLFSTDCFTTVWTSACETVNEQSDELLTLFIKRARTQLTNFNCSAHG